MKKAYRLEVLKEYADTLSDLITELAGEADSILGDEGANSMGDDLIWNSRAESVTDWLKKNGIKVKR